MAETPEKKEVLTPNKLKEKHQNARQDVLDAFNDLIRDFQEHVKKTPLSDLEMATAMSALSMPIDRFIIDWVAEEAALAGVEDNTAEHLELMKEKHGQAMEIIQILKRYLEKHTKGYEEHITPEVLAKITSEYVTSAQNLNEVLKLNEDGKEHNLVSILRWVLGAQLNSSTKPEKAKTPEELAKEETDMMKLLGQELKENWEAKVEGRANQMACIWTVVALMSSSQRIELIKSFAKTQSHNNLREFFIEATEHGALNPLEVEAVFISRAEEANKDADAKEIAIKAKQAFEATFSRAEFQKMQTAYLHQNRAITSMADQLTHVPAGSVNAAVDMLNLKNVGLFLLTAAAFTTATANVVFNIRNGISGIAKSHAIPAAVTGAGLMKFGYGEGRASKTLTSVETNQRWSRNKGLMLLPEALVTDGGRALDAEFIASDEMRATFDDFLQSPLALNEDKELREEISIGAFLKFIDQRIASQKKGAKTKDWDYNLMKSKLEKYGELDITGMARVFHQLKQGKDNPVSNYLVLRRQAIGLEAK